MQATDFTRDSCIVGTRRVPYKTLTRYYVCNDCGGRIVTKCAGGYYAECGACGGQDFVSTKTFTQQTIDAWTVRQGLPANLRALLDDEEPVTVSEAIADLYG